MSKYSTGAIRAAAGDSLFHRQPRKDGARAFMPEPEPGHTTIPDSLAENLAEAFLESATSGEERGEVMLNEFVAEDIGGPFLEEDAAEEN